MERAPVTRRSSRRLFPALAALLLLAGGAVVSLSAPAGIAGWQKVDPPAGPGAMAPSLTLGKDGKDLLLTWLEPLPARAGARPEEGGKSYALRFSRLRGGRWSAPVTVASGDNFFANWADFPAVGQAPDGSLTAHWLAKTGDDTYAYGIFLARSTDGGATWRRAGMLHGDRVPAEHGFVSWLTQPGGLRAFWLDGRETPKGGAMALRTGLIGKAGSEELLDPRVCDCCQTDAALTAGGPIVAFRDRSDKEVRDIYVVRKTAKGWSKPTPVHADNWQIPGCPVNGPAIAASGRQVAVAWFTAAPPSPRVQIAFSRDGGATFGRPVLVDGGKPLGRVDLALDRSGDAIVSWLALRGKGAAVHLRRVGPQGKLGAPVTVAATSAARSSGFPRTALSGDRLYLAWVEDGKPSKVRVASLAPSPALSR